MKDLFKTSGEQLRDPVLAEVASARMKVVTFGAAMTLRTLSATTPELITRPSEPISSPEYADKMTVTQYPEVAPPEQVVAQQAEVYQQVSAENQHHVAAARAAVEQALEVSNG